MMNEDKDEIARLIELNDSLEDELVAAREIIKVLKVDKKYADKLIDAIRKAMEEYE